MKILHIASFQGNIGDNASHIGFYNILDSIVKNYKVEKLGLLRSIYYFMHWAVNGFLKYR